MCRIPPKIDEKIESYSISIMKFIVLFHVVFAIWVFGNDKIFNEVFLAFVFANIFKEISAFGEISSALNFMNSYLATDVSYIAEFWNRFKKAQNYFIIIISLLFIVITIFMYALFFLKSFIFLFQRIFWAQIRRFFGCLCKCAAASRKKYYKDEPFYSCR